MKSLMLWLPALVLALGATFTVGVDTQRTMGLDRPLREMIPHELVGLTGRDVKVPDAELVVAGVSDHVMRNFDRVDGSGRRPGMQVYIGYYDRQTQGKTIHSPKNCLPGGGWKPLASRREILTTPAGRVPVNRYLLQNGEDYALVLYWYQGRGRVEANEYVVKWDLLRDAALRQRSEEALVRIVVPITRGEAESFTLASSAAAELVPTLHRVLPD